MPESPNQQELRILAHYADGAELKSIAVMVGMTRDDVLQVVEEFVGFERARAKLLVGREQRKRNGNARVEQIPARLRTEPVPPLELEVPVEYTLSPAEPAPERSATLPAKLTSPAKRRDAGPPATFTPQPAPAAAPPNGVRPGEHLAWWDAWLCELCFVRFFTPRVCCGGKRTVPVTVTVSRREVSRG